MAITNLSRDWGVNPSIVRMVTTDSLSTITTEGYLNLQANNIRAIQNGDFEWVDTDQIAIDYLDGKGLFTRIPETNSLELIVAEGDFVLFTPTVTFSNAGNLSVVYASQFGVAVKTGSMVDVNVSIGFTPTYTTSSGFFIIQGFPYEVQTDMGGYVSGLGSSANLVFPTGTTMLVATAFGGGRTGVLKGLGTSHAEVLLTTTQMGSGQSFLINATYKYLTP